MLPGAAFEGCTPEVAFAIKLGTPGLPATFEGPPAEAPLGAACFCCDAPFFLPFAAAALGAWFKSLLAADVAVDGPLGPFPGPWGDAAAVGAVA